MINYYPRNRNYCNSYKNPGTLMYKYSMNIHWNCILKDPLRLEWNKILDVHINNGYSSVKTRVRYINQLLLYNNYKTKFVSVIGKSKKERKNRFVTFNTN